MKTATAAAEPHAVVELVPLDKIAEDPGNPRRTFTGIEELAESIKEHGVLQPITVRPMPGIGSNLSMIVIGARRYRAAKLAGLEAIPAMRRELTDTEALEIQLVENLNRPDVHPMEEAEGYQRLLDSAERKYSVEDIAAKVGKSKAYVYGRLKLTNLCAEARKAFLDAKLTPSTALLIARIPSAELQKEALEAVKPSSWEKSPKSSAEVSDIIRDHFMLRLAEAPFSRDDADMVKGAGACASCGKRSGAQPELFADLSKKDGDVCTDPPCFESKKKAWAARKLAEAEASGQRVIAGDEAKKFAPNGFVAGGAGVLRLDEPCWEDPKHRTWKQILGKAAPVALLEVRPGELVEVVDKKAAADVLREKGARLPGELAPKGSRDPSFDRERRKQLIKRRGVEKTITLIVEKAETQGIDEGWLVDAVLDLAWHDTATDLAKRRGLEFGKGIRPEDALEKHRKKLGPEQLRGLLVEALVTRGAYFAYQDGHTDRLRSAAKLYGINIEKCKAEAERELKEKEGAKKSKAKKAPAKKKGKGAARG